MAIDKINNIDGLLSFGEVKHHMQPKALVSLILKIAFIQEQSKRSPQELRAKPEYDELIEFLAQNWVTGSMSSIPDRDRMQILTALVEAGLPSRRLLGSAAKHIVMGGTSSVETLS